MKKTRIVSLCISAFLSVGLISSAATSGMYAKYSSTSNGTLNVEFNTTGKFIADTLSARFSEILNDTSDEGDFKTLIKGMNEADNRADASYAGNVVGTSPEDKELINGLFSDFTDTDGDLIMNEKEVTIMIKRENLDDDFSTWRVEEGLETGETEGTGYIAGSEITLYVTSETPSGTGRTGVSIEVFAMIYSKVDEPNGGDGKWHMIAQYQGTATSNDYTGNFWNPTYNSFDTDSWRATSGMYYRDQNKTNALTGTNLTAGTMLSSEYVAVTNLANIKAGLPVIE